MEESSMRGNFAMLAPWAMPRKRTRGHSTIQAGKVRQALSDRQKRVAACLDHRHFDTAIGVAIFSNLVVIAWDVNTSAACQDQPCMDARIMTLNTVFLVCYTVELSMRVYVGGVAFFCRGWSPPLDTAVVLVGWLDLIFSYGVSVSSLPPIGMLRVFRILRLARLFRLGSVFPELYSMLQGFRSAMLAMWWGFVMITVLLFLYSIMAVELVSTVRGRNAMEGYCDEAFSSVFNAVLYFFQTLIAADSWGRCTIPLVKMAPITLGILFFSALITIQLGFANLVLATIVETATAARAQNLEHQARAKEKEKQETADKLEQIVHEMDEDGDGFIDSEELLTGYEKIPEITKLFTTLDIHKDDLVAMFAFMDHDNSGTLSFEEFFQAIHRAQSQDFRVQMMVINLQMTKVVDHMIDLAALLLPHVGQAVPEDLFQPSVTMRSDLPAVAQRTMQLGSRIRACRKTKLLGDCHAGVTEDVAPCPKDLPSLPSEQGAWSLPLCSPQCDTPTPPVDCMPKPDVEPCASCARPPPHRPTIVQLLRRASRVQERQGSLPEPLPSLPEGMSAEDVKMLPPSKWAKTANGDQELISGV